VALLGDYTYRSAPCLGITGVILGNMKTAISVPDDLFRMAERAAHRLGVSRSELYAKAVAEFLRRRDEGAITERLNAIYSRRPAKLDTRLRRAQLKSLERSPWQA
jgi:metal-responsive CopG/Arc/MetJ family transcriptional regulator